VKATLSLDPRNVECGPASAAVRQLLAEWVEIDWLSRGNANPVRAAEQLRQHHELARWNRPDLFGEPPNITARQSGWTGLDALCRTVREPGGWDWKYGALKPLSQHHSKARGWSLQSAPDCPLFLKLGPHTLWNAPGVLAPEAPENARWYFDYARLDLIAALEWQLAESSSDLIGNPFVPLLRCYSSGCLPFFLDRDTVALWSLS